MKTFAAALTLASCRCVEPLNDKHNVLVITVDDLRTELAEAFQVPDVKTPNLDQFASTATTFRRAYCQMAVCSPSRNSFLTGKRPDTTKIWNFVDSFRDTDGGADWTTMPEYFKNAGYKVYGAGKLFHPGSPPNNDFPRSWTEDEYNTFYWGNGAPIGDSDSCFIDNTNLTLPLVGPWNYSGVCQTVNDTEALNNHDNRTQPQTQQSTEYDHRVGTRAIEFLEHAKAEGGNFYVTAGFRKPHLEWRVPHKFWEQYNASGIRLAQEQTIGRGVPTLAFEMNGGMGQVYTDPSNQTYRISPDGPPLPAELQQQLRKAYYSAVSFMDYEVGRILGALDRLDMRSSTAVVFHSDHGWKLGEHGDWSKCTNWELDARVPLLIRAPWIAASAGASTLAFAELVDLYPTLIDLAGLPSPPVSLGLEGQSLVPVLRDPSESTKQAAYSQYPRCPQYDMYKEAENFECLDVPKSQITRMGYSVRTAEARYTEWREWWPTCSADWSDAGLVAVELYNHTGDNGLGSRAFDLYEFDNLASEESAQPLRKHLAEMLKKQFDRFDPEFDNCK